jgi:hypothetical protein
VPPTDDALAAFARELEGLLPVRAHVRRGEDGDAAWVYLLVGVHAPSLIEAVDGAVGADASALHVEETYLRLGFSALGPFVALQEVRVTRASEGGVTVVGEEPLLGVEDRRLQAIVKALQGKLRAEKRVLLDMAFLLQGGRDAKAPPSSDAYVSRYGEAPTLFAFLFDPVPPATPRYALLARDT